MEALDAEIKPFRTLFNKSFYFVNKFQFHCCGWGYGSLEAITGKLTCAVESGAGVDCKAKFVDFLNTNAQLLGWVAIGVALVEVSSLFYFKAVIIVLF